MAGWKRSATIVWSLGCVLMALGLRTCSILREFWRVGKCGDNNFVIYDTYLPFVVTLNFMSYAWTDKVQVTDKSVYKATYLFDVQKFINMFPITVSMSSSNFHPVVFISIEPCNIYFQHWFELNSNIAIRGVEKQLNYSPKTTLEMTSWPVCIRKNGGKLVR